MQEVVKLLAPLNTTKLEGYAEGTDISMWMRAGVPGEASFSRKCSFFTFFSFIIPASRKKNSTHSLVELFELPSCGEHQRIPSSLILGADKWAEWNMPSILSSRREIPQCGRKNWKCSVHKILWRCIAVYCFRRKLGKAPSATTLSFYDLKITWCLHALFHGKQCIWWWNQFSLRGQWEAPFPNSSGTIFLTSVSCISTGWTQWLNGNLYLIVSLQSGASLHVADSRYFWFHHSEGDTMAVQDPGEMNLCSALWAVVAYVVADLEDMLPR